MVRIDEMNCPSCGEPMTLYRRTPREYGHWICDASASCLPLDAAPAPTPAPNIDETLDELENAVDDAYGQLKEALEALTLYQHNQG